jgi:hypothetical protein
MRDEPVASGHQIFIIGHLRVKIPAILGMLPKQICRPAGYFWAPTI